MKALAHLQAVADAAQRAANALQTFSEELAKLAALARESKARFAALQKPRA